jgi:hypothetical protein
MATGTGSRATGQKAITLTDLTWFNPSVERLAIHHLRCKHDREADLVDHILQVLDEPSPFVSSTLKVSRSVVRYRNALLISDVSKHNLQETLGSVNASDKLFTTRDPDSNHGLNRQALTCDEGAYLAATLRRVRDIVSENVRLQECTLAAFVVTPLLSLIVASPEYHQALGCFSL